MSTARGTFTVIDGGEVALREAPGEVRLTHITGQQRFEGDITGDGAVEWLMAYSADRSARFVGFQRIDGSIGGRSGSFLMESTGDHDGASSTGKWRVIPGSGTGALAGITGVGSFRAPGGRTVEYELEYELA